MQFTDNPPCNSLQKTCKSIYKGFTKPLIDDFRHLFYIWSTSSYEWSNALRSLNYKNNKNYVAPKKQNFKVTIILCISNPE